MRRCARCRRPVAAGDLIVDVRQVKWADQHGIRIGTDRAPDDMSVAHLACPSTEPTTLDDIAPST